MSEKTERQAKLAKDIMILSRNTLLVNLRFLDVALSQFEYVPMESDTMLTDGKHLLYHPPHVLENYKHAKEIPVRDYLHIVMHCIFRHMYMDPSLDRVYWDLACDIAVENAINELALTAVIAPRQESQASFIEAIKKSLKYVTTEKIYSYLKQTQEDRTRIAELRGLFYADNHEIWYMTAGEIAAAYGIGAAENPQDRNDDTQNNDNVPVHSSYSRKRPIYVRPKILFLLDWFGYSHLLRYHVFEENV